MTGISFLARYREHAYALLRIVTGLLFMFHGLQKVFGALGGQAVPLASQAGAAGLIELVGGVLVMVGLATVPAAFIASGEMAFAYFMVHVPRGFWPIENQGELAALYCFVFLFIAARGAGIWSVDGLLSGTGAGVSKADLEVRYPHGRTHA